VQVEFGEEFITLTADMADAKIGVIIKDDSGSRG